MDQERPSIEKLGLKELVAIGVGGMVGGGIFSVLGLSVSLSGNAAPIAFAFGGHHRTFNRILVCKAWDSIQVRWWELYIPRARIFQ